MALTVGIVEGWTGPLDFQLLDDGEAHDLTGQTVTGQARNRMRLPVTLTGDVTVTDTTTGKVRINPDTGDFLEAQSPYELRFKVVTAGGDIFYPSEEPVNLEVRI